jgi:DNA-binding transcriptional LysR family regulator
MRRCSARATATAGASASRSLLRPATFYPAAGRGDKIALAVRAPRLAQRAARAIGTTQPTVSRRLAGFERKTGVKLFERGKDGLTPTQPGAALTDALDLMDEGALAVERRIASRDTGLQGPITVTSLDGLGDCIIVTIAARFGRLHPRVEIETAQRYAHLQYVPAGR